MNVLNSFDIVSESSINQGLIISQNNFTEKYRYFNKRIETFESWPPAHPINKNKLCASGFVYSGKSDRVICFTCKIVLHGFAATDNVFAEHQKYAPDCEYIKMVLPSKKLEF